MWALPCPYFNFDVVFWHAPTVLAPHDIPQLSGMFLRMAGAAGHEILPPIGTRAFRPQTDHDRAAACKLARRIAEDEVALVNRPNALPPRTGDIGPLRDRHRRISPR